MGYKKMGTLKKWEKMGGKNGEKMGTQYIFT